MQSDESVKVKHVLACDGCHWPAFFQEKATLLKGCEQRKEWLEDVVQEFARLSLRLSATKHTHGSFAVSSEMERCPRCRVEKLLVELARGIRSE